MCDIEVKGNDNEAENKVAVSLYRKFIYNSTKIDIAVELLRHGTLSDETLLEILEVDSSLSENCFKGFTPITKTLYDVFVEQQARIDVLTNYLKTEEYASKENILRILNTELAIEEADKIAREMERMRERFNNK